MFTTFYHQLIRRYHLAFGSLFNTLVLVRTNSANTEVQRLTVPIEYSAREAWLSRLRQDPELEQKVQIVIPRLAYEMTGLHYDSSRKLNSLNQRVTPTETGVTKVYMGAPFIITLNLYAYTRTLEDMNQIVEQIIPYFTPDYVVTVKTVPALGVTDRCRILMDAGSPQWSDNYEAAGLHETREVITTFSFSMLANFYGPATEASVIRRVLVDMYTLEESASLDVTQKVETEVFEDVLLEDETGRMVVEASETDVAGAARVTRIEVNPDPIDAAPDKPVDSETTITDFVDGKQANVFSNEDVDIDI